MSLDAEEQEEPELPDIQQPEVLSIMGEELRMDLIIVGKHW
jgi:hypothetical protein